MLSWFKDENQKDSEINVISKFLNILFTRFDGLYKNTLHDQYFSNNSYMFSKGYWKVHYFTCQCTFHKGNGVTFDL